MLIDELLASIHKVSIQQFNAGTALDKSFARLEIVVTDEVLAAGRNAYAAANAAGIATYSLHLSGNVTFGPPPGATNLTSVVPIKLHVFNRAVRALESAYFTYLSTARGD